VVENNTVRFGQISHVDGVRGRERHGAGNRLLGALQSATSFAVTDGQLQIFYDGGI
jgi:hypothetical protein